MKSLKNIALCLDLTEMDSLLLNYLKKLDEAFPIAKLTLLHLIELEEFSEQITSLVPGLGKSIDQVIESEIREKAAQYFGEAANRIQIHVHSGGDVESFANYIDGQKFDLLMLGKKHTQFGEGILSGKLVRLTSCDTLFLPETASPIFEEVVVALDFSAYTDKVLQVAIGLQNKANSHLHAFHVIKIGIRYFPYIKNPDKLHEELEKEALKRYKKLQEKYRLDSPLTLIKDNEHHISRLLYNQAILSSANLIIVGNKGQKDEGDLLIGSVAEQLIAHDKNLPVWIVK